VIDGGRPPSVEAALLVLAALTVTVIDADRAPSMTLPPLVIAAAICSVCVPLLSGGRGESQSNVPEPDAVQAAFGSTTRELSTYIANA
jgi:hypothetical protein